MFQFSTLIRSRLQIVLLLLFSLGCSKTSKQTLSDTTPIEDTTSIISEDYRLSTDFYFAVRFQFTKNAAQAIHARRVPGSFPLTIAPAFDAFVVTYQREILKSFYAIPNPLETMQDYADQDTVLHGLLLPSWLAQQSRLEDVTICIYAVGEYIEDWESSLQPRQNLEQNIAKCVFKPLYEIDVNNLQKKLAE
ncbi:MAG: hypothetical protein AAF738_06110 [Bacteroidota bacterium]